ncbi:MAG: hypothetical protein IT581_10785 [Verrucomicrobiales bacterium]|nr:hypothetical protein [Verrucomicrobiales bacterium]
MTTEELRKLLADQLAAIRTWSHSRLAEAIGAQTHSGGCLQHVSATMSDGTRCHMQFTVAWEDQGAKDIRVVGELSAESRQRWVRFVPGSHSYVTDGFIMRPDGTSMDTPQACCDEVATSSSRRLRPRS